MRLVGLKEFRALPNGTVYEAVERCCAPAGFLCVKESNNDIVDTDWYYMSINGAENTTTMENCPVPESVGVDQSHPMHTATIGRQGMYQEEGEIFFWIYETADVMKLMAIFAAALIESKADLNIDYVKEHVADMPLLGDNAPDLAKTLDAIKVLVETLRTPKSTNSDPASK